MPIKSNNEGASFSVRERLEAVSHLCIIHFDEFYNYRQKSFESLAEALFIVFSLVESVRDNEQDIAEVDKLLLKKRGITPQSNTPLELKLIKLAYDFTRESEDRLRKWARVLIAAHQNGQDANSFKHWLTAVGGVKAAAQKATPSSSKSSLDKQPDSAGLGSGSDSKDKSTVDGGDKSDPETPQEPGEEPEVLADDIVEGFGQLVDTPEVVVPGNYVQIVSMGSDRCFKVLHSSNDPKLLRYVQSKLGSNDNLSENEKRAQAQFDSVVA